MKQWTMIVMLGLVVGCGGNAAESAPPATPAAMAHEGHGAKAPAGPVKAMGDAKVGDTTKCPVSGEDFVVDAHSEKSEHGGKTYYFCCPGCKKKFDASPEKFLNKT
jgi:YHS domain-containing protein